MEKNQAEKKPLHLTELRVQSFVTELDDERLKALRGGHTVCPDNSGGDSHYWTCPFTGQTVCTCIFDYCFP